MNLKSCTSHAPWKAEFSGKKVAGWGVLSARDEIVAYIPQSIVHDESNARLIASAPEMLQALESIVDAYQRYFDVMPVAWQSYDDHARSIISKVKGEA